MHSFPSPHFIFAVLFYGFSFSNISFERPVAITCLAFLAIALVKYPVPYPNSIPSP
jgi:hypothetical protein